MVTHFWESESGFESWFMGKMPMPQSMRGVFCKHSEDGSEKAFPAVGHILRARSMGGMGVMPIYQRRTRPIEGDGKCVTHITVGPSQKRSNTLRRVSPACRES